MLNILRRIVQEISSAQHFKEALQILVKRVREAIATEACTVFLIDKTRQEYVLSATDGLNPQSIGKVQLRLDQGLVGLVGQREEPINLEDAPSHPNFFYSAEAAEERYKAFLGVPIIHHRHLLGVLVVQQEAKRRFDETEEAFLVTISAQLGGLIAHAQATGSIAQIFNHRLLQGNEADISFSGLAAAPGIAIGKAVIIYPLADLDAVPDRPARDIEQELKAFNQALAQAQADILTLIDRLADRFLVEEKSLFDAYLRILQSTTLTSEVVAEILTGNWAAGALRKVINRHIARFEAMDDDYLRERAIDLRDLGRRVLLHLQAGHQTNITYPKRTVLIGQEIAAASLFEIPPERLVGIISIHGSRNSHLAVLARALGIPTVMGVQGLPISQLEGKTVIVDGYEGSVYFNPSPKVHKNFKLLLQQQHELASSLEELRHLPAQTLDQHTMDLWVNTGIAADAKLALSAGAAGVGLYRTEIAFMQRDSFPTEEEQFILYRQLLSAFSPRPVIMRTLDIGGDKILPYFPINEANPFLGWRGIRVTLDHPEIFLIQLRAMLRANGEFNNLRIMLPMLTTISEVEEALRLIEQAHQEVFLEQAEVCKPPIGAMIEVPASIYLAPNLLQRVDFLSVGSNDLTQYLLAVDRNNSQVASLYDHFHPAVLQALQQVVTMAKAAGKPISICGEMASDPLAVPVLLALGFNALSMSSVALPRIKFLIRHFSLQQARDLLAEILQLEHALTIRTRLTHALHAANLGKLLGAKQ